ncbi:MAG: hypothetical protein ABII00_03990, partial [Elusimicrobiota bacterium]
MTVEELRQRSLQGVGLSLCLFCLLVPFTIAGANIAWGVLLACLLAYAWSGGRLPLKARRSATEKPLWAFLAVSVLTALLGVAPLHSARFLHQDAHKVWLYLLFTVALAAEPAPKAIVCMAAGFSFAAIVGIVQAFPSITAGSTMNAWDMTRAHAFVHPVTFGEQMAVAVLGAFSFLLVPPDGWPRKACRAGAAAVLALAGLAMLMSNTRGAMLGCVAGLAAAC